MIIAYVLFLIKSFFSMINEMFSFFSNFSHTEYVGFRSKMSYKAVELSRMGKNGTRFGQSLVLPNKTSIKIIVTKKKKHKCWTRNVSQRLLKGIPHLLFLACRGCLTISFFSTTGTSGFTVPPSSFSSFSTSFSSADSWTSTGATGGATPFRLVARR